MKFTIESFKTHIYRPAEWMVNNEKISHLIGDLTKQFLSERFCSYSDADGETFKITVSTDVCEDENEILTVKFLNISNTNSNDIEKRMLVYDKVYFEDDFEMLINKTGLPYWTAATLLKKVNALVFKVLTDMQEYDDVMTYRCKS